MNEEINAWINAGRDYKAGVSLYEEYGSSASLKRLLRMNGATKSNQESLNYELGKLVKGMVPINKNQPISRPVAKPAPPEVKPVITGRRPNTPLADELRNHIISLMKVRDQFHATLEHVSTQQRGKDAMMILSISDEITDGFERLDHFDKHGVLPVKPVKVERKPVDEMDIPELMKLQQNLRTYVSRYKKKMDNAKSNAAKENNRQWMDKYQLQLNDVEKRLRK